jgi:hypothetical protein
VKRLGRWSTAHRSHAERAEDLGLEDTWVSEHIIVPRDALRKVADEIRGGADYGADALAREADHLKENPDRRSGR